MPKFKKGSKEAKEHMEKIRAKKKNVKEKSEVEGGKLNFKKIKKSIKKTVKKIENLPKKVEKIRTTLILGRNDYPPKVRKILKEVGDKYIKSITIKRNPVNSLLTATLNAVSFGEFKKRMDKTFDNLFHLYIELTLDDDKKVLLEKNEVINMDINPQPKPETESKLVNNPIPHKTINEMLDETKQFMGQDRFFSYSAHSNNCQDFITAFFKANNIGDENDISFIKQDTEQLFDKLPLLKKFSDTVTDLGAKVDVIRTGAGLDTIKNYSDILHHLIGHITDPKEPIDPNDYKQAKEMIDAIKKEKSSLKLGGTVGKKKYEIQSVVFNKDQFTVASAKKWLKANNYKSPKVDRETNTLRFRQLDPDYIENKGYNDYKTKKLGKSGIMLIIAYKK